MVWIRRIVSTPSKQNQDNTRQAAIRDPSNKVTDKGLKYKIQLPREQKDKVCVSGFKRQVFRVGSECQVMESKARLKNVPAKSTLAARFSPAGRTDRYY